MTMRALARGLASMNWNKGAADVTQKAGSFFVAKHKGQFMSTSSPKYGNSPAGTRNSSTIPNPDLVDDNELDWTTLGCSKEKIEIDNVLINWERAGNGEHVVLLLPGIIGCIQHDFIPLFLKMDKKKYTIVSWDPPGYGRSRPPLRDFTGVFYQRDGHMVVKLMDKLGYEKFSILGWSNGGITGGHIAADYPSRVRRLVTWGSHSYADDRAVKFSQEMCDRAFWSKSMLEAAERMYGPEYLFKMMRDWHKAVSDFYKEGLDVTFKEGLPKIQCPTLHIHGGKDAVLGVEHAEFLRDNIPNSSFWLMPDGKHNLHLRYTDEFLAVVTKFLDSDKSRAKDMLQSALV
ncbi:unnamed protein product [Orchesella dallaii]|uniref:AB hydrolase-1 domain-containing protein n=1 Tax=Orchesella dallaii TaxID=48710 RepID=A0ABP1PJX3_9HEXA